MAQKMEAGKICNTHGLRGYVKVLPWTDTPDVFELFEYLTIRGKEYHVDALTYQKNHLLIKLEGVDTVSDAEKLKDSVVYCNREDIGDLPQDTYFVADLLGCFVVENERVLGQVTYVFQNGGADLYEVTAEDGKVLYIPAVKEFILGIDLKEKKIRVSLPEGLE